MSGLSRDWYSAHPGISTRYGAEPSRTCRCFMLFCQPMCQLYPDATDREYPQAEWRSLRGGYAVRSLSAWADEYQQDTGVVNDGSSASENLEVPRGAL
jgi:hypothetical protein